MMVTLMMRMMVMKTMKLIIALKITPLTVTMTFNKYEMTIC